MLANFPYRRAGQSPLAQIVHPEGLITINKIFRWLTLLLGYLFLAVRWQLSQNGRYAARGCAGALTGFRQVHLANNI
jgi:hypothetical protein